MNINIKYTLIFFLFYISLVGCLQKNQDPYAWLIALPKPWSLSESEFEKILPEFHKNHPDFHERLIAINFWRIGTPYRAFCLGEEKGLDKDPLIRIDSSDCTIHVLTTIAFANSFSWMESRQEITKIHYKNNNQNQKKPTYQSRWHYTSDRILNHSITPNITPTIIDKDSLKYIDIELNKKRDGSEFLDLGWTLNQKIGYLSIDKISEDIMEKLPAICGVAFVKEAYFRMGVVIGHEGFIINNKDLIHASSEFKKTVNIDFLTYLNKDGKPRFDGVLFYKINQY